MQARPFFVCYSFFIMSAKAPFIMSDKGLFYDVTMLLFVMFPRRSGNAEQQTANKRVIIPLTAETQHRGAQGPF